MKPYAHVLDWLRGAIASRLPLISAALRSPIALASFCHRSRRRTIVAIVTAPCLALLLLTLEYLPRFAPDNDVTDWWQHYEIWHSIGTPSGGHVLRADGRPILIPPQLLPTDTVRLKGRFADDSQPLIVFAKRKARIASVINDSLYRTRSRYTLLWFVGIDARDLRLGIARATGAHTLPLPPNYRKPFWRLPMRILGGDPEGDASYFKMLDGYHAHHPFVRSVLYDIEPWWLYCLMWPTLLYVVKRYWLLLGAMATLLTRLDGGRDRLAILLPKPWPTLLDGAIWVLGCIAAWASISNVYLPWTQRVLYVLCFTTCFLPGVMLYWRLAAMSHALVRRLPEVSGARPGGYDCNEIVRGHVDKAVLFGFTGLWLATAVIIERGGPFPRSMTLVEATALIWVAATAGLAVLVWQTWDPADKLSQQGLASWRDRVVGDDWLFLVLASLLSVMAGPMSLVNLLPAK